MQIDPSRQYQFSELPQDIVNSSNGDIKTYNGQQVHVIVNNNNTRSLVPLTAQEQAVNSAQALQQFQVQANQPAIQTLQNQYNPSTGGGALVDKYNDLLSSIKGVGSVAVNQATLGAANELGQRGLLPSSSLYQQSVGSALQPVTSGIQQNLATVGLGEQQDLGNIANQIAQLQAGNPTASITGAQNLLQLQQQQQLIPSQIGYTQAQTQEAQTAANYIPTAYGGNIFNTSSGNFQNPLTNFLTTGNITPISTNTNNSNNNYTPTAINTAKKNTNNNNPTGNNTFNAINTGYATGYA